MAKTVYYCDMDGVLADFFGVEGCVERFKTEKHFFRNLKPIEENVNALRLMLIKGYRVKILSTSPHKRADTDKMIWIKKFLPEIKINDVIFARPNHEKIEYVIKRERGNSILIDDYGKNIRAWLENGGANAIKILGGNERKENVSYGQFTHLGLYADLI